MARRSAKRIVLDEVASKTADARRLYRKWRDSLAGCEATNSKEYMIWYKRAMCRAAEAKNIALLLGATPDEVYSAMNDGEKMAYAAE